MVMRMVLLASADIAGPVPKKSSQVLDLLGPTRVMVLDGGLPWAYHMRRSGELLSVVSSSAVFLFKRVVSKGSTLQSSTLGSSWRWLKLKSEAQSI